MICRHRHSWLIAVVICLFLSPEARSGNAQNRGLKILLTNDDGFDSAGLKVMRSALLAAGHQVSVVAPATNMSSSSMSMTSGTLKVEHQGDGVWAVHGTPTDAAMIGLAHLLRETSHDLVISGTNAGQNLGSSTNGSGTVSAALAAARFGVPAIATSAGLGPDIAIAYETAAALTTQMITALMASRPEGGKLLPERLVINMNVPALSAAKLQGIRWAPLSSRSPYARVYTTSANPDEVVSRLTASGGAGDEKETDLALFAQGFVTLTVLDGDLSVTAASTAAVTSRLSRLRVPLK
jgi:5'/3'-nucleotidase SurE